MVVVAVEIEIAAAFRCSFPHPRLKGQLCNALLAKLTPTQADHIAGVPLRCWRCKEITIFE